MKKFQTIFFALLFIAQGLLAQTNTVTGKVTDGENGDPLIGVTVVVLNSSNLGTITDFDGNFSIQAENGDTLQISYIGYQSQQFVVQGNQNLDVKLFPDSEVLDEVVVIGYGAQTKKEVTGSVSIVDANKIERLNVTQTDQALQGQVSGVQITSNSGSPGSTSNIRIRGISTNGDNRPLILVDGNVIEDISVLNPSDIESIQVLKDATAGIYGVRAANGVILITTKSGSFNKKLSVDLNMFTGVQTTSKKLDVLNATEYAAIINEAHVAGGENPPYPNIANLPNNTDWQDEVFETSPILNINTTISGGLKNLSYSVGGSYLNQQGIVGSDKSNFERYTGRANLTYKVFDPLKVEASVIYTHSNRKTLVENALGSVLFNAVNMAPTLAVRDEEGKFTLAEGLGNEVINPVAQIANTFNNSDVNRLSGRGAIIYEIIPNLEFTSAFQFNRSTVDGINFFPMQQYGSGKVFNVDTAFMTTNNDEYEDYTWDNFINYKVSTGDHNFKFLVGMSAFRTQGDLNGFEGRGLNSNNFDDAKLENARRVMDLYINGGDRFDVRLLSYFGRVQYDFKNKYLLSASLRRDGSSAFGPENRFGYFPTVSAGWVVSEEDFMANNSWINLLKLRGSFGIIGNDRIAANAFRSLLNGEATYVFNNDLVFGAASGMLSNPAIKWEEQFTTNIGLDLSAFNDQIGVTIEVFQRETRDLLVSPPVSGILGAAAPGSSTPLVNAGTIQNRGIEAMITYNKELGTDNYMTFSVNGTLLDNDVISVNNGIGFIQGGAFGVGQSPPSRMEVGQPIGYFYGYKTDGVFQNRAELEAHANQPNAGIGDLRFVDINEDGVINEDDRTYLGDPIPDLLFGFNWSWNIANFDVGLSTFGSIGNEIVRNYERQQPLTNKLAYTLDRWTGPNSSNEDPRQTIGATSNSLFSDYFVEDGSFFRIQNVQLGYTFKNISSMQKLRVYFSVNNLHTFTNYRGFDPSASGGSPIGAGIDNGFYPIAKAFMFGINAKF